MAARKSDGKKRARQQSGSAKRKRRGPLPGCRVHNLVPGEWIKDVCGDVTKIGGQLVEIPKA
jgi:hypothetical protein